MRETEGGASNSRRSSDSSVVASTHVMDSNDNCQQTRSRPRTNGYVLFPIHSGCAFDLISNGRQRGPGKQNIHEQNRVQGLLELTSETRPFPIAGGAYLSLRSTQLPTFPQKHFATQNQRRPAAGFAP